MLQLFLICWLLYCCMSHFLIDMLSILLSCIYTVLNCWILNFLIVLLNIYFIFLLLCWVLYWWTSHFLIVMLSVGIILVMPSAVLVSFSFLILMLSAAFFIVMLSAVMLNVVRPSVVAPSSLSFFFNLRPFLRQPVTTTYFRCLSTIQQHFMAIPPPTLT